MKTQEKGSRHQRNDARPRSMVAKVWVALGGASGVDLFFFSST